MQNQDIVTDRSNVYWTIKGDLAPPIVQKVAVSGGAPVTLAAEAGSANAQDCYWRIAVDAQAVYWSSGVSAFPVGCAIRKVPIAGGPITTVVDYAYLRDFTIDANNVYFSELGSNPGSIQKTPLNGGTVTPVATDVSAWVMTNDASNLYWIDPKNLTIDEISKAPGTATSQVFQFPVVLQMNPQLAAKGWPSIRMASTAPRRRSWGTSIRSGSRSQVGETRQKMLLAQAWRGAAG